MDDIAFLCYSSSIMFGEIMTEKRKYFKMIGKILPEIDEENRQHYIQNVTRRFQLADRILQSVREGNGYQAGQDIKTRNKLRMPGHLTNELTERKYDLIQIKALMTQALREIGVEDLYLDRVHTEYTRRIDRIESVDEYNRLAEEMVRDYCGLTRLKSFQNYSPLVRRIILEVDMGLSNSLTLAYFAENLNVNRSYLSNLFRQEIGVTLTEYVTSRRIRHAADLLLTSQNPIKKVAEQVGIADVHYFSRLFKREMGQTPSQYRESRKGAPVQDHVKAASSVHK